MPAARLSPFPRRDGEACRPGSRSSPPAAPEGPAGATANAVCSLSIEPMLMLACLDRGSRTLLAVQAADRFGVSVLHEGQEPIARSFATKAPVAEKWAGRRLERARRRPGDRRRPGLDRLRPARRARRRRPRDRHRRGQRPGDERGRPAGLPRRRVPAAGLNSPRRPTSNPGGRPPRRCCRRDRGRRRRSSAGDRSGGEPGAPLSVPPASRAAAWNASTVSRSAAPKEMWAPLTVGRPRAMIQK